MNPLWGQTLRLSGIKLSAEFARFASEKLEGSDSTGVLVDDLFAYWAFHCRTSAFILPDEPHRTLFRRLLKEARFSVQARRKPGDRLLVRNVCWRPDPVTGAIYYRNFPLVQPPPRPPLWGGPEANDGDTSSSGEVSNG